MPIHSMNPEEALAQLRLVTGALPERLSDLQASAAFMSRLDDTARWTVGGLHTLAQLAISPEVEAAQREDARIEYQNAIFARANEPSMTGNLSTGERALWQLAVGALFGYGRNPGVVPLDLIWELDTSNREFVFSILERMK